MKDKRNLLLPIAGCILLAAGLITILAGVPSVTDNLSVRSIPLLYSATGTLLLAVGGSLVIYWRQQRNGNGPSRRPKKSCITAEIIGVSRNLRFAGERVAYHVVCRCTDPDSGETVTYSSDPLDEYPGKEIIGKTVLVYLDQKEEGHYRVDLSTIQ